MADKAAIFGINDYKSVNSLRGCLNDVENMRSLLTSTFDFDPKNVKTFVNNKVTKTEVQRQMKWLFRDVAEGDRVVLHFSGHGSFTADVSGDEEDGQDELICLYDMDFNDPDSYVLDDELRDWTQTLPQGVQLTVILDSCHSGTGTRLLLAPEVNKPHNSMSVDVSATLKRSLSAAGPGARGIEVAAAALDPAHQDLVRARFIDPPQSIKDTIAQLAKTRPKTKARGLVRAKINHILLAACKDDQTAADATIEGQPNGAFTYYLCKTLRANGASLDREALINQVGAALTAGQFAQIPQLEASAGSGPLFGAKRGAATQSTTDATPTQPVVAGPVDDSHGTLELLSKIVGTGGTLDPAAQKQALEILSRIVGGAGAPRTVAERGAGRFLVTIHGICQQVHGYSNPWWSALHPFTNVFGAGTLDDTRREVLWSDLVNQRAVRAVGDSSAAERAEFAARVRGVLEDRTAAVGFQEAASPAAARDLLTRDLSATRGLTIPGLNCIDDFTVYMFDDSLRAQVIGRFTSVVRPLLQMGAEIDIIGHSWGTVVAYEGLRELEDAGLATPLVRNFFTAGSALSLFPVKMRLRPANKDGHKPAMIRKWINLNAKGDPVGGHLQGQPYQVDEEDLDLPNLGCFFFDAPCAHSSYFKSDNILVNRDIFARNINAP
jgi:metacaspase-1